MKQTFQFKEVSTFNNLTVDEVIQKLKVLIETADDFEDKYAKKKERY